MKKDGPTIVYVKDGAEQTRHVREFAHLTPSARPDVWCLECGNFLILKLGPKNVHHAAHKPDTLCALTKPETVLHLNTKAYLHGVLRGASELFVLQSCSGWVAPAVGHLAGGPRGCVGEKRRPFLWLSGWDNVEMERRVETRKPDIVFYRAGLPVAAIEVFATHAVDEMKKADLARFGVPWVEVKADEELYEGVDAWRATEPLPYVTLEPQLPTWTCERCQTEPGRYVERAEKIVEERRLRQEEEARRILEDKKRFNEDRIRESQIRHSLNQLESSHPHPRHTHLARLIFVYNHDGTRLTLEYFLTREKLSDGSEDINLLVGREGKCLFYHRGAYTLEVQQEATARYREHLDSLTRLAFASVHATGWVPYSHITETLVSWRSPYLWNKEKESWEPRGQTP